MDPDPAAVTAAATAAAGFAAWVGALMDPRERAPLVRAVAEDARIERNAPRDRDAPVPAPVEVFDGLDAIERWVRRVPPRTVWTLVGAPVADGDAWRVEYGLACDGFENGGIWVARFGADGRLVHLSHRPFPVPDKWLNP